MIRLHAQRLALVLISLAGCGSSSTGASSGGPGGNSDGAGGDDAQASPSDGDASAEVPGDGTGDDATVPPSGTHGDGGKTSGDGGAAPPGNDASTATAAARPSPGCSKTGATSATENLSSGGMARTYDLHVPPSASGPSPLVINMHGYTGSSAQQETLTNMNALADTEGFLVAYPQGVGSPADWNAGACCSASSEGDRDDIGFLNAVIDDVGARTCVDLARVYAIGFSNGGMMSYRLACEDAPRFAAFASVSGSAAVDLTACSPSHPMPLFHVHGNADPLVPYDGGNGGLPLSGRPTPVFPAAADEVAAFRSKDGCPSTSSVYFSQGNAHCDHWGPCTDGSEVIFCTIDQGAHAWPGATGVFSEASPLDATAEIWTFLKRHALP
jgi:polyhydroxybutyrate depolymerase